MMFPFSLFAQFRGMIRFAILLVCIFFSLQAFSQSAKEKKYRFSGYVKYLQTTNFSEGLDNIITDNLIHHRLNFRYAPVEPLTFAVEIRDRIYFGELVKLTNIFGDFGELIDNNDIYDMSVVLVDKKAFVWHVMLDRAFVRYSKNKWEATLGRQRINWGVTLAWNPNDIFNAYSLYDFDYEERLGSDAARIIFYPNSSSSIEITSKIATEKNEVVSAALYKFNKAKFDFQAFSGVAHKDVVAGGGWAGNIKNAGFKGEFSYFHPYRHFTDSTGVFTGVLSVDYSFKNSLYLNSSFLYVSNGSNDANFFLSVFNISAKTLSPYKYNFFVQALYPITPFLNAGLSTLYSPGSHALFINPVLTYNIKEDWDIDLVGQLFFSNVNDEYKDQAELLYFRLRWSY